MSFSLSTLFLVLAVLLVAFIIYLVLVYFGVDFTCCFRQFRTHGSSEDPPRAERWI